MQEGAQVRNLSVNGIMTQKSSQSTMGGVVGQNFGTITHCSFTGSMAGDTNLVGFCGERGIEGRRGEGSSFYRGCSVHRHACRRSSPV